MGPTAGTEMSALLLISTLTWTLEFPDVGLPVEDGTPSFETPSFTDVVDQVMYALKNSTTLTSQKYDNDGLQGDVNDPMDSMKEAFETWKNNPLPGVKIPGADDTPPSIQNKIGADDTVPDFKSLLCQFSAFGSCEEQPSYQAGESIASAQMMKSTLSAFSVLGVVAAVVVVLSIRKRTSQSTDDPVGVQLL